MKLKEIIFVFLVQILLIQSAFAFPNCQAKYDSDKRSLPSKHGQCSVCHINPSGGGPTNEFGKAFASAGFMITDALVASFPNLFQKTNEDQNPSGSAGVSSSSGSAQLPAPFIKRIKPNKFKVNMQSMAQIMGQNFVNGTKALIDNNEVMTTFKSKAMLVIDFVLSSVGSHDLKVKNPDGQESSPVKIKVK